jgi:hypothetical protein
MGLLIWNVANYKTSAPAGQASRGPQDELNSTIGAGAVHHTQPSPHDTSTQPSPHNISHIESAPCRLARHERKF